ncbi:MAG: polysaccharide deacetylase [Acidobacteria bacterium]|nr:MAG: polysaccharide deacetylase [Acidobacteriota bacterium]
MGFLTPWFLAGAVAAGLPIYLHLLRRHRTTPLPFSSLMFFERRTQSSIKHRRLRYLLLLAFRLAVILLLALAFANPFIERSAASIGGEKLNLLVIDDSFSMRAGTRLADAKRDALAVLDTRKPSERVQVMALGSQVHVLTEPTQDSGVLRSAVNSIQPGDTRASFGELAGTLHSMAETVHTPIELHLFSDMQRSAMPGSFAEMALPGNVSLVLHQEARGSEPNWTVESVSAPGEVFDPKKSRVQAVISGYHTPAAKRTVSLVVNGKTIATQTVDVPPEGRASVEFSSLDVPYGLTRCEVRIDSADSLPADDASLFAVKRSDPRKVLFVYESNDTRSPLYFRAALTSAAESAFSLETVTVDRVANVQPAGHDFVVLSDVASLPSSFESTLTNYVKAGGSVFVAAGTSAARHPRIPIFGDTITDSRYYSREGARFLTVGQTDPSYPSVEKANRWAGVKFYFAVRVAGTDARVAARLTDQTPLLLEKKIGEGRVLLFASGLDNFTNDFPLHPVFIPFIDQTARYLSGMETRAGSRIVDSFLELRTAKEQSVGVEVIDPEGKRPLSLREATAAQSFQLTRAGFYQLRLANGREDLVGVNADRRESDLDMIPKDMLALWTGDTGNLPQDASSGPLAQDQKKPYSLWWYAMLLLLIAAIAESLLSSQYLTMSREEP